MQLHARDDKLKVVKGALVIMKSEKIEILYNLVRRTTVDRVTISITTKLDLIDTKLYYICLGHLSE